MNDITHETPDYSAVAQSFHAFAAHCIGVAPLYALLAPLIAADHELLELAAQTQPGQPAPNMLFAAVHDQLLADPQQPLARYYATVGGEYAPDAETFGLFRSFCLEQRAILGQQIRTRFTQTNEVQRSTYLLPGLALVQQEAGGQALALIELGPSAGLNLNLDRYGYRYSDGRMCGDPAATVQLSGVMRGDYRPPIPAQPPTISWRIGIERNPIDLHDPAARRWLEALIWPENTERMRLFRAATAEALRVPPPIMQGDLLVDLEPMLAQAPPDATMCVIHTHVLYQIAPELRASVDSVLLRASMQRPIYRLGSEHDGAHFPRVILHRYIDGKQHQEVLAHTTGHANWIEWLKG